MEPRRTKISEKERQDQLKVWNAHQQVGERVYIGLEPDNAKKHDLTLGSVHKIVEPPGNYINSCAGVWVMGKGGKKVCVGFAHGRYLPKGAKVNMDKLTNKTETEPKVYKEALPEVDAFTQFEAIVSVVKAFKRKRKVEPVVVRRRRRT